MTFIIHANLDCEATWAGVPLPAQVRDRISAFGWLLAALAPARDDIELWTPAAIEPRRLHVPAGWAAPRLCAGTPARADLRWASPGARAANDRRLALAVARDAGCVVPGARVIHDVRELETSQGPWVCKVPWTSAGRDRCHGNGAPDAEQATYLTRLLAKHGALVFEPWLERTFDLGVCAMVHGDGSTSAEQPHRLLTDRRGRFRGIDLTPPELLDRERAQLDRAIAATGDALAKLAYQGPFTIDAFGYRVDGERRFHPLCEINARHSFGLIARALGRRLGIRELGFGPAPDDATTLIAPGRDGATAWVRA
ncbi:MAG: hypothetical protein AB7P03_11175 [Kofleriaceae bacterium]